jgi:hypothetical protein
MVAIFAPSSSSRKTSPLRIAATTLIDNITLEHLFCSAVSDVEVYNSDFGALFRFTC